MASDSQPRGILGELGEPKVANLRVTDSGKGGLPKPFVG